MSSPRSFKSATLTPPLVVCDVIPNPPRTWLIRTAEQRGCRVLDGLGMLVAQGVIGSRLWTGREPNPVVMRQALLELVTLARPLAEAVDIFRNPE